MNVRCEWVISKLKIWINSHIFCSRHAKKVCWLRLKRVDMKGYCMIWHLHYEHMLERYCFNFWSSCSSSSSSSLPFILPVQWKTTTGSAFLCWSNGLSCDTSTRTGLNEASSSACGFLLGNSGSCSTGSSWSSPPPPPPPPRRNHPSCSQSWRHCNYVCFWVLHWSRTGYRRPAFRHLLCLNMSNLDRYVYVCVPPTILTLASKNGCTQDSPIGPCANLGFLNSWMNPKVIHVCTRFCTYQELH